MEFQKKLKMILKIRKVSQEILARELGVSFVSLNNWLNGGFSPKLKNREKIDDLYLRLTGDSKVPENVLKEKKQVLALRVAGLGNVMSRLMRRDVLDDFLVKITYNSNRIEGSTFTEAETARVLLRKVVLPSKDVVEHLEVVNHKTAMMFLLKMIEANEAFTEELFVRLHGILMSGILENAGEYREHNVRIVGTMVVTANYPSVPKKMGKLFELINEDREDVVGHCSFVHSEFEKIHPFSDGNGRIGRLLLVAMLLRAGYVPAIIKQEKKSFYFSALQKAQVDGDTSLLEEFLCEACELGVEVFFK